MRTIFYDQDEAQKAITLRQKSYIRIAAYFFLFIAGVLAGMAIAGVMV
jgi:hypothetical protein